VLISILGVPEVYLMALSMRFIIALFKSSLSALIIILFGELLKVISPYAASI